VHYTTSCNTQSSAPEDWQNHRPKHVELIGIINKLLLLQLVGCLYYLYQWCTVKQISNNPKSDGNIQLPDRTSNTWRSSGKVFLFGRCRVHLWPWTLLSWLIFSYFPSNPRHYHWYLAFTYRPYIQATMASFHVLPL